MGGQDATEAFEDVGHSDEAREILTGLLVGDLKRMVCVLWRVQSACDGTQVDAAFSNLNVTPFLLLTRPFPSSPYMPTL